MNHILYTICRHYQSKNLIRRGFTKLKKQIFLCKDYKRHQISNKDKRQKYSKKIINIAFILFSECNNYRRTARILSKKLTKKFISIINSLDLKKIEDILEISSDFFQIAKTLPKSVDF